MPAYYGLTSSRALVECIVDVCDLLGRGANNCADDQMFEIAAVETHSGKLPDAHTLRAGVGWSQIDRICFDDVLIHAKTEDKEKIRLRYGVVLDAMQYEFIAFSPLLAAIFCRLALKRIVEEIPRTLPLRARYWKKYYNTYLGSGSEQHYINCVKDFKVGVY